MDFISMTSITKQENDLFQKWEIALRRHGADGGFYSDGVPFPEDYEKSYVRTIFVLREPNFEESDRNRPDDLRERLQNGDDSARRWWVQRLGYLCAGITSCWNGIYDSAPSDRFSRAEDLRPFGFIQLKKTPGGGKSICKELEHTAARDREMIREQLGIYKPQVIIACGLGRCSTFRLLRDVVFSTDDNVPFMTMLSRECVKITARQPFYLLATYHPSAFVSREKKRDELCIDYKAIVKKIKVG